MSALTTSLQRPTTRVWPGRSLSLCKVVPEGATGANYAVLTTAAFVRHSVALWALVATTLPCWHTHFPSLWSRQTNIKPLQQRAQHTMRGCLGGSWNAAANHAHSNTCCCRPPHTNHRRLRSGGHPSNVLGQIGSRQPAAATAHQRWSVQASVTTAAAAANNSAAEAAAASSTTSKRVVWVQTTNQV